MREGVGITTLLDQVMAETETKRDLLASDPLLKIRHEIERGVLMDIAEESMVVRDYAQGQLASKLDIPAKYWARMLKEAPELLAVNANTWLGRSDKRRLLRTIRGEVRAVLSPGYRIRDNLDLMECVVPILREANCKVESCNVSETHLHIQATLPTLERELKLGDVVRAGIVISNSEVGAGKTKVMPMVYRLRCLNGMVIMEGGMGAAHIGRNMDGGDDIPEEWIKDETRMAEDRAWWLKIADSLRGSLSEANFSLTLDRIQASTGRAITKDPVQVIEVVKKRLNLTDKERGAALLALCSGENDMTQWGLANSITGLANSSDVPYDRAVDLEVMGGQVAQWSSAEWNEINRQN